MADADAPAGETVVAEVVLDRVEPGTTSPGTVVAIPGDSFDLGEVRVVVDPDGVVPECDEEDNGVLVPDPR